MVVCEPGGRLPWKPWAHVLMSLSSGYLPLQQELSLQTGSERPLEAHMGGETQGCDPSLTSSVSPALLSRPELLSRAEPVSRGDTACCPH